MVTPDNDRSRKYTAATILILGFLLLVTVIGMLIVASLRANVDDRPLTETTESNSDEQMTETPLSNNSNIEPTPSPPLALRPSVEVSSTQVIAPLLSFNQMIESGETDRYLFQAAADVPLTVKLEIVHDLRLGMQIVDKDNTVLYDEEFDRGQHDITFHVRLTGDYRIILTSVSGQGEYIISMAFTTKPGKRL